MEISLFLLTILASLAKASLRGSRRLFDVDPSMGMAVTMPFSELRCNRNISPCVPYSSRYGQKNIFLNRMIVPCGTCIIMDLADDLLLLNDGLDIRGKLIFPDNYRLTVQTSMVVVQGELEMTSSQQVDGDPPIKFILHGNSDLESFLPIHNNEGICPVGCAVGPNSFTVAGGKVTLNGLPPNTPSWLKVFDADSTSIVVPDLVKNKWAPGSTVVITSNDQSYFGDQVRKISHVVSSRHNGHVRLILDKPIHRPQVVRDNVGFAVEVALLSRNIRIEGYPDGHFWVLYTPKIVQMIEGIEFKNMGQKSQLGRYPIHLHFCGDVSGSRVTKNSVHNSNNRGLVIHGTNNALVDDNVIFNIVGHGYILEDGIETGNMFYRNLAVRILDTHPLELIPPTPVNGDETDDEASAFWITSANNSWVENVVAGSQSNGFWFELRIRGVFADEYADVDPLAVPIGEFRDNEIHSVYGMGMRYYLFGFFPPTVQEFVGTQFNRNRHIALQIHRTRNILISNSYFSDNPIGIMADRAESIQVENTTIIGYSPAFRSLVENYRFAMTPCSGNIDRLEGLKFEPTNPWANDRDEPSLTGLILKRVTFDGYSNGPCGYNTAIHLLPNRYTFSTLDLFVQSDDVSVEPEMIDFCDGVAVEAHNAYMTDLSSTISDGHSERPSTVVANIPGLLQFIIPGRCNVNPNKCTAYCRDTCFRTVHYYVPQDQSDGLQLQVCNARDRSLCQLVKGYTHYHYWPRRYTVHLPGWRRYDLVFVKNGKEMYPAGVQVVFETKLCPTAPDEDHVILRDLPIGVTHGPTMSPSTLYDSCSRLIQNGDMELGYQGYWRAFDDVQLYNTDQGYGSSTALGVTGRTRLWHSVLYASELINERCLTSGSMWKVSAKLKLIETATGNDVGCNFLSTCPVLMASFRLGDRGEEMYNVAIRVTGRSEGNWGPGFNDFMGYFTVPDDYVRGLDLQFAEQDLSADLIIDNFQITRFESASGTLPPSKEPIFPPTSAPTSFAESSPCSSLVDPSGMTLHVSNYWYGYGRGNVYTVPGQIGFAVGITGRDNLWNGLGYHMNDHSDKTCMIPGSKWEITASMKLIDSNSAQGVSCDLHSNESGASCPNVKVGLRDLLWDQTIINVTGFRQWNPEGFNFFRGSFQFPVESDDWIGRVRDTLLIITDYALGTDLIVDHFAIRRLD